MVSPFLMFSNGKLTLRILISKNPAVNSWINDVDDANILYFLLVFMFGFFFLE